MDEKIPNTGPQNHISRRNVLKTAAGTGIAAAISLTCGSCATSRKSIKKGITNGRINQSIAYWCFQKYWDIEKTCRVAKYLGCKSIELVESKYWPALKKYDLICAMNLSHGYDKGMNNPWYQNTCIEILRKSIDECSMYEFPNVITFTGFREDISDDVGLRNCVNGYKKIIGYAEKKNVNICLEIINSRIDNEIKAYNGYQGDHVDYCIEIIKQVGSPRMKLLFDIYNVQIMDGDIISRIRQHKDYIGHYQIAGVPDHNEPDDRQEINYKPIMEEIVKTGYTGYVGHEFNPKNNPAISLRNAVIMCDV